MKRKLFYRELNCWVELDEETYLEIRRERQRTYYKQHKNGQCFCRKKELWLCDGMCDTCKFNGNGDVIFSSLVSEEESLESLRCCSDNGLQACCLEEGMCHKAMLKRVSELMPSALEYGRLKLLGKTEEEIAMEMGVARMTLYRRIQKVKRIIQSEFSEK